MEQNTDSKNITIINSLLTKGKGNSMAKDILFKEWFRKNCTSTCKKKSNLHTKLTPLTKINSKFIRNLI